MTPCLIINNVSTIMFLLEGLLGPIPDDKKTQEVIENYFQFAAVWAFGGPQVVDKQTDFRSKFSEEFTSAFVTKYPKEGLVFDYFYDHTTNEYLHWSTKVPTYTPIMSKY